MLEEAVRVRQDGGRVDGDDGLEDVGAAEPAPASWGVTDTDVALEGEDDGQPDGGRVRDRREVLGQDQVDRTPRVGDPVVAVLEGVEEDVAGQGPDTGQHVGYGDGHQKGVGRRSHVWLQQDEADEAVREESEDDEKWRDDSVHADDERVVFQQDGTLSVVPDARR